MAFLQAALLAVLISASYSPADEGDALRDAARKGDAAKVKELLAAKVDVNAATEYGVTPLALACDHDREEVVKLLLEAGADPNIKDRFYHFSPLLHATFKGNPATVKLLLQHGAKDADAALPFAVGMRNVEIVRAFIESEKLSESARLEALASAKLAAAAPTVEAATQIVELLQKTLTPEAIERFEKEKSTPADLTKLKPYEGLFQSQGGARVEMRIINGQLHAHDLDAEQSLPLKAEDEEGVFSVRGVTVRFRKEKDVVAAMIWKTGDAETVFERVAGEAAKVADVEPEPPAIDLGPDFPMESENWPSFRGALARGINSAQPIATKWNGETGENIAWKTPIDGLGTSSPVVWGKSVYITTAIDSADQSGFRTGAFGDVSSVEAVGECSYQLWRLDLDTGEVIWKQEAARRKPEVKRHSKSSHANPTPATDGKHVIAFFGEAGIHCYDSEGKRLWQRDLGLLDSGWFYDRSYQWGFGSSPFIFEDMVLVQCDIQDESFIAALDIETGETRWKTPRAEIPTWSSPVAFYTPDGVPTVVVSGTKCTAAYNARTGEELWKMGGFSEIVVPTPQVTPKVALFTSGYSPVQPIVALFHSARGDLKLPEGKATEPFLWSQLRGGPYMPTPLIHDNRVYILENSGILSCYDLATGKRRFRQRLRNEKATTYTSSPISAGGLLYCTSEEGHTFIVTADLEGHTVAENDLGEAVLATGAIAQGVLLLRGEKHLFAIVEKESGK